MMWSRRNVLKGLGWAGAGLTAIAGPAYALAPWPALPHRKAPSADDAAAWVSLRPDGRVELVLPRTEIGQGIAVSFRQIVAEETGFPLERVVAIHPRSDRLPPTRATVGSDSIKDFGLLLAQASAALAAALKQNGVDSAAPPSGGWAAFVAKPRILAAAAINAAQPVSFKRGAARRVVGKPAATDQIRAIVTGDTPLYADDVRLPGMVFAAALRAPRLGATLGNIDDTAAHAIQGYLGLHLIKTGAFIAAATRGSLERCVAAVKTAWVGGDVASDVIARSIDIDSGLSRGALEHAIVQSGTLSEPFDIDLRLDVPMAAHGSMEPRTAVARFDEHGRIEIWTGTQDVTFVHSVVAKSMRLSSDRVVVHGCRVGGGFGGKTICIQELDAALLAQVLKRPVKIQWTRIDEFREGFHRPPSSHRIKARLTSDGRLDTWHHAFRSGHVIFTSAAMGTALQFATSFVGDPGVSRGALPPYASANTRVEFEDVRLPVHTGPWRSLGAAANIWAIETAIDALARKSREDGVAFRRRLIAPQWPRLSRALDRVAAAANWPTLKSSPDIAYGVACGIYKDMSYAGVIAEVTRSRGRMRVTKLWCAHDCGLIINPDQVRAQVEGNLVWGLGMALHEELGIVDGHLGATSFADYPVPRYSDVPDMIIDLVDAGDASTGAGETAIVAATAAITNAISAMTGKTVTRLPWRDRTV
jgi:isoquinoline 1-oxidoreductase subunit beta